MQKLFSFLIISFFLNFSFAQKFEIQTLLKDKISIRAIQIWKGKVYYAGTDSKFGYVSLKDTVDKKQIKLSNKKLQFRTLAQDRNSFYTINIESPAYFFKIDKKTLKSKIIANDTLKTAFYDALIFTKDQHKGYAVSDPDKDNNLVLVEYSNYDQLWKKINFEKEIKLHEGEAFFAASNTNIAIAKNTLWIASGGTSTRIFKSNRFHPTTFEIFETPIIQGTSSTGIYSIDFYDEKFGIAVGGDYTKQFENINNIATTNDGGKTWQIQASGKNGGYKTCVKIRPNSKGKDIIAVGDQNIEFSQDFGKTWTKISDEKNLYFCEWVDRNTVVFAGKDRIIKAYFRFYSK